MNSETYEFYKEVVKETPEGEEVTVLELVGHDSVRNLEREKESLNVELSRVQEKLDIINNL